MPWALMVSLLLAWPAGGIATPTPVRESPLLVLRPEQPPVEVEVVSLEGWPYLDLLDLSFEAGWALSWDPGGLTARISLPTEPARLLVGSTRVLVGDRIEWLSRPPRVLAGRPLVPLDLCRIMDDNLGEAAKYDPSRRSMVVRTVEVSLPSGSEGSGRPVIVLDPGHGGEDPGQTVPGGGSEARLAWRLCREIQQELLRMEGPPSVLTRARGEGPAREERCRLIHARGGDLVLCVHVGAPVGGPPVLRVVTSTPGAPVEGDESSLPAWGSIAPAQAEVASAWATGLAARLEQAFPELLVRTASLPLRAARLYQRPTILLELPPFGSEGALPEDPDGFALLASRLAEALAAWEEGP